MRSTTCHSLTQVRIQSSKYHGGSGVCIKTEKLEIKYRGGPLTRKSLRVSVVGAPHKQPYAKWRYGDEAAWESSCKLEGAVRTLDHCNGRVDLESSLLSRSGWTIVDDSQSVLLGIDDAWVHTRAELDDARAKDLYVFHYGSEYQQMLDEFVRLSGRVPLLPRFALGNWYSRWWQYSQAEVTALVALFEHYRIPLSVMVLDMDWHVVERAADTSRGWTGYSWNTELFPEHRALLADLKRRGVRVTLNLHPADGVHSHELAYAAVAAKLHVDASTGEPVPFRCTDARFVESYLTDLHHPHERDGIEFWWIDWQQGRQSEMRGLDPLYWLNHVHSLDAERPNHPAATREHQRLRRVILSRWAGLGNHRYPLGFSGDTHTTWESLRFQPYLTQASANVCFGWWSHDIGGFGMDGCENEELYIRWVQFGLYSPILRLHSMKVRVRASLSPMPRWLIERSCTGCQRRAEAMGLGLAGADCRRPCHATPTRVTAVPVHDGVRVSREQSSSHSSHVPHAPDVGARVPLAAAVLVRLAAARGSHH